MYKNNRIGVLDAWRTLAIVCMIIYHLLYDLYIFGVISADAMFSSPLNIFERFICVSFILLCGVSSKMSRSNIRRGLITFACAIIVSAAGYIIGQPIWFGILHFLGLSMILSGLFDKWRGRIPGTIKTAFVPAVFCLALFFIAQRWTNNAVTNIRFLFPLGFRSPGFTSADYFPLLPWFFLFLLGTILGSFIMNHRENAVLKLSFPQYITWPGRHSLIIYLLHQPILYGLTYIFAALIFPSAHV